MFSYIWHTFFFDPVYNSLVFFIDIFPHGDLGLAIIATVILLKVILFPLSIKMVKTQKVMRDLQPKLDEINKTHKDNREARALATMALYRESGANPFASLLVMFIQLPLLIALGIVAMYGSGGIKLPAINTETLYQFIAVPTEVSMMFLGHFDIAAKSIFLAFLAGLTQYISTSLSLPKPTPRNTDPDATPNFKDEFMRNMHLQMKYVMPFLTAFISYTLSAAIALYFIVSNLTMIIQELIVRKHR